jgi:transcriptional regulator with XRE-family HTH domain
MDNRGYAARIVNANNAADDTSPGVRLGRFCIKTEVPVSDVAKYFGVSRMTVYQWFSGKWIPRKAHTEKIEKILKSEVK